MTEMPDDEDEETREYAPTLVFRLHGTLAFILYALFSLYIVESIEYKDRDHTAAEICLYTGRIQPCQGEGMCFRSSILLLRSRRTVNPGCIRLVR